MRLNRRSAIVSSLNTRKVADSRHVFRIRKDSRSQARIVVKCASNRVGHGAYARIAHWNCAEQFSVVRLKYFKMLIWLEQSNSYTRTVASLIRLADNSGKSFASLSRFRCQKYVAYSSALGLVCALFFRVVWFRLSRPRSRDTS